MYDIGFLKSQLGPCVWYKEEMVPLFYVDYCLFFSPSKNKIDEVYVSLQEDINMEEDGDINIYLVIYLVCRLDGSIHLSQPYLAQRIINMIPGMYKSSDKPNPVVKPPLEKKGAQAIKKTLIIDQ